MITTDEIHQQARQLNITPAAVQRDYVLGWLIFGVFARSALGRHLILKGGNALRKAYFANTRFSDDLDFTTQENLDPETLARELDLVCQFVQEHTGVAFDLEQNRVEEGRFITKEKRVYKVRLYFRGFAEHFEHLTLRVNVDITQNDRLSLPAQMRALIHPYSDGDDCRTELRCVQLEEVLADKLKCLLQRRRSHDLYDLVHALFINTKVAIDRKAIIETFLGKTIFKPSPPALRDLLLEVPFEVFRDYWRKAIACPEGSHLPFDSAVDHFRQEIPALFAPFSYGEHASVAFFPARLRNPILEAGSGWKVLRVEYDGVTRLVEPYSLVFKRRMDGHGQEYLYVYDRTGGRSSGPDIKSFVHSKLTRVEVTDEQFQPRFEVELSKAGEFGDRSYFGRPFGGGTRAAGQVRRALSFSGMTYRIRCPFCNKTFRRKTMFDARLNAHKNEYGFPCSGTIGFPD
ncbi:MAG TPA: nucleotidyl transferase AbiEii/AbiGii toxin family protein [Nitrolancea sp.]|nr:nucleotidyl transferase AbiEii/AbiGii toxin family protein [Nitrolancea sp.]